MNPSGQAKAATPEEVKRNRRRCSGFKHNKPYNMERCESRAWLEDWAGWRWCFGHWLWQFRNGGRFSPGDGIFKNIDTWIFELKRLKIF